MGSSNDTEDRLGGEHASIWLETTERTSYDEFDGGVTVDTAVVGGGIAGITTAARLREAGQSVALIERDRIVESVTGHTTAKLTSLHGLVYSHVVKQFGERKARQYADANQTAIDHVESTVADRDIDCDFERGSAYTYVVSDDQRRKVTKEAEIANRLGLPASYTESTDLPYEVAGAVRFDQQAHFHPRKYLLELAADVDAPSEDSYVFENTKATGVEDGDPCTVSTERGDVTADDVVVATHFPVFDRGRYYERLHPMRSYVLAVRLRGDVPKGMYYEHGRPTFSVRPVPAGEESTVLVGGQGHRTGHASDAGERYRKLEQEAREWFDVESVEYRWSTQDFVSVDGVPFVGKLGPGSNHVYTATGFGGWGMTNGTAAGLLLSDLVLGRDNEWREVYDPTRFDEQASRDSFAHHNMHDVKHYVTDYDERPVNEDASAVGEGSAEIVRGEDGPTAVYRDPHGEVHEVSAVCTHMGCLVEWNDAEQSWACPCHGSRFDVDGEVLDGPANQDLSKRD